MSISVQDCCRAPLLGGGGEASGVDFHVSTIFSFVLHLFLPRLVEFQVSGPSRGIGVL